MEDTAPRRTPPPRPAILQLSTPKHAVPEVSLLCDSESSLTWQPSRHNTATTTTTTTIAEPFSGFPRSTTRWPQPQPTQDFLRHAPRMAKGTSPISPLAAPCLTGAQRFTLRHKTAENVPPSNASPPIQLDEEYNPQLYSPLSKHSPQGMPVTQAGPERRNPSGGQGTSNRVRFSLANDVPRPSGVPQGPHVGIVSSAGKDVRQNTLSTHSSSLSPAVTQQNNPSGTLGTVPSAVRGVRQNSVGNPGIIPPTDSVRQEKAVEGMQGDIRPPIVPQASHIPQNNTYKPSYPVGGHVNGCSSLQTISSVSSTAPSHTYMGAVPPPSLISTATTGTTSYPPASSTVPGNTYRAPVPAPPLVSTVRTTTYSPAFTAAPSLSHRPALHPVSTTTRTTTYPPPSNTVLNNAFIDHSSPHFAPPRPETYSGAYNADWSSPASASLQTPPTNPYIPQRAEYVGQAWGHHPERHYSPNLPVAGVPHSPADPVVYGLIEDQKQQILKLTKDLQKIMEKQAKEEEEERTPRGTRQGRCSQKHSHCDAATQTQHKPALVTTGVNTDISWPDLIASLRYQVEEEEETDTTDPHYRDQGRNEWLRDIKMNNNNIHSHQRFTRQRNSIESASEITSDDSRGGSELSSGQEWVQQQQQQQQTRPTPTPTPYNTTAGLTRGDTGAGQQRTLPARGQGDTPKGASPLLPPPPVGTTFYHNVMTNIHQILQHTNPSQEQQQQQQPFPPSQGGVMRAGTGECVGGGGAGPDPQIEAVRRQLLNFGVSFLDPATLTPSHRPLVDSLYLPGLHNTVSLYQTSLTATTTHLHHHPSDAMAAKYLTDSQLAAIAAASPAMKQHSDQAGNPSLPSSGLPTTHHLYRLHPDADDNNNSVSMATRKFLEKYGLQED